MIKAFRFELAKVTRKEIRARMLTILREVSPDLAKAVAVGLGLEVPQTPVTVPPGTSAPGPRGDNAGITASAALSLENQPKGDISTRKIAMIVAPGFDAVSALAIQDALVAQNAIVEVVAPRLGPIAPRDGEPLEADKTFQTAASVAYDAVFVPDGATIAQLAADPDISRFVRHAHLHCKAIAGIGAGAKLLAQLGIDADPGVVTAKSADGDIAEAFIAAIAKHRHWAREAPPAMS
jgi:catalase